MDHYSLPIHFLEGFFLFQVIFDRVASRKQKLKSIDPKVKRRLRLALGTLFYSVYTSPITKYIIDTTYQLLFVIAQSYMLTVVYEIQDRNCFLCPREQNFWYLFRLCPPPPAHVIAYYLHPRTHVPYFYLMTRNETCSVSGGGGGGGHKRKRFNFCFN